MIPKELIQKIRHIEIRTKRLVNDVMAGEYHSVFKGRGMEFTEVREYQLGDDVRTVDWNVTARMGHPYVKRFAEERDLTVLFLVDASLSGEFGTATRMKVDIAAEICALMAFSAIQNNDRVGLILFSDRIGKYVPPKKGRNHVLRLIRELFVEAEPISEDTRFPSPGWRQRAAGVWKGATGRGNGNDQEKRKGGNLFQRFVQPLRSRARETGYRGRTDLSLALRYVRQVQKRKSIVFLISDFLAEDCEKELRLVNQKHDLVCCVVVDPREEELPSVKQAWNPGEVTGYIDLEDAETGEIITVNLGSEQTRRAFAQQSQKGAVELTGRFQRLGIDFIRVRTDEDYVPPLVRLFEERASRY
jgi:uncharacterized protein (DUF58 family)